MNIGKLREMLERDEGLRLKPYHDSVGKLTIGIGRNLDDVGISKAEAYHLLDNDIENVENELQRLPIYRKLDTARQTVLGNMAFNIGVPRLLGFKKMWAALDVGNYDEAAAQMLDSTWAKQVGARADRLEAIMRTGEF